MPRLTVVSTRAPRRALPSMDGFECPVDRVLPRAAARARALGSLYFGDLDPRDAWLLASAGRLLLIDVRTEEERAYVGRVPACLHIPWRLGLDQRENPRFLELLDTRAERTHPLAFLCRSGSRSKAAATAAANAGFLRACNVLDGFEGARDAEGRRGNLGGWKSLGLPWTQD